MIKNIFYKIMADDGQRQKMNSLKDQSKIYNLFCENGYAGSFDDFKKEMKDFLNSDDSLKIIHNDFDELSDDMLELVAGGANVKKLVTASIATLMLTFTVSATLGSSLFQGNNVDNDVPVSASSELYSDGDNKEDNSTSNGGTSKSTSNGGTSKSTSGSRKSRGRSASVGSVRRGGKPSGQSGPDRRAFNPVSTSNADNYKAISSHGLYFDDYISQNPEFLKFLEQNPEIAKHMAKDYHFAKKMMYNNDFRNRVMNDASFRNELIKNRNELIKNGFREKLTNIDKGVSKSNKFNQQSNQQNDKLAMINHLNNVVNIHKRSAQEYAKNAFYSSKELKTLYRKLANRETMAAQHLSDMVNELKSGAIEDIADSNYAAQYKAVSKEIDDLKKQTFKADYELLKKEVDVLSERQKEMFKSRNSSVKFFGEEAPKGKKERNYKKMIMDYDKVIKNIQEKISGLDSSNEYKPKFEELKLKAEKEQNTAKQREQKQKQREQKQKQREQKQKQKQEEQQLTEQQKQKQKQITTLKKWIKCGDSANLSNKHTMSVNPNYLYIDDDYKSFKIEANKFLEAKDTDKYDVEKAEEFIKSNKNRVENIFYSAKLDYDKNMFK